MPDIRIFWGLLLLGLTAVAADPTPEERVSDALRKVVERQEAELNSEVSRLSSAQAFNAHLQTLKSVEQLLLRTKDADQNKRNRAQAMTLIEGLPRALQNEFAPQLEILSRMDEPSAHIAREILLDLGAQAPKREAQHPTRQSAAIDPSSTEKAIGEHRELMAQLLKTQDLFKRCPAESKIREARQPLAQSVAQAQKLVDSGAERRKAKEAELAAWSKSTWPVFEAFRADMSKLYQFEIDFSGAKDEKRLREELAPDSPAFRRELSESTLLEFADISWFYRQPGKVGKEAPSSYLSRLTSFLVNPPKGAFSDEARTQLTPAGEKTLSEILTHSYLDSNLLKILRERGAKVRLASLDPASVKALREKLPRVLELAKEEGTRIRNQEAFGDVLEGERKQLESLRAKLAALDRELDGVCQLRSDTFAAIEAAAKEAKTASAVRKTIEQTKNLEKLQPHMKKDGETNH